MTERQRRCAPFAGKPRLYVKDAGGYHFGCCLGIISDDRSGFDLGGTIYDGAFLQRLTEK
ncbi:hypothetical protein [Bacillus halotolerans]|uniref:Uncharacterized protein n=1 Tax=Bacillus halotolerans TaxID=260554 RepID=A0A9Q4ERL2_9BACI|nr:hypothetical protein [Bacillus halotolerans]MCY9186319.1 hypothetical protein [Bacillus halotolerans]MCY9201057.1 hypothetical protein [Bacillus halotolerans]